MPQYPKHLPTVCHSGLNRLLWQNEVLGQYGADRRAAADYVLRRSSSGSARGCAILAALRKSK
eukprot:5422516-Alexandrium_andersonii.AAC.1